MKFSEAYKLEKNQADLDFVNIFMDKDTALFIDPWAIRQGDDDFSLTCHDIISDYFELLIKNIKKGKKTEAMRMLDCLHEPPETHLGLSRKGTSGLAIGNGHAKEIYDKLTKSMAVKTGFLGDLEDCALMIDGINADKISDIVTNLIRMPLTKYTQSQCELHNIPTRELPSGYYWNSFKKDWCAKRERFPIYNNNKIILVPKYIVRRTLSLNPEDYYNFDILEFEQARHLDARTSLCRTLKDGALKEPTKKSLKKESPCDKEFIYSITKRNPQLLSRYKKRKSDSFIPIDNFDIIDIQKNRSLEEVNEIDKLVNKLDNVTPGNKSADSYHNLMIGILEQLFYPNLVDPKKEYPINSGRKRIDISFSNISNKGFFSNLPKLNIPCKKIHFECKNYSNEIKNPEFDQLNGRFSQNISQIGFIICREVKDRSKFVERCRDFVRDKRHYIIGLDDSDIKELLSYQERKEYSKIDKFLENKLQEINKQ